MPAHRGGLLVIALTLIVAVIIVMNFDWGMPGSP